MNWIGTGFSSIFTAILVAIFLVLPALSPQVQFAIFPNTKSPGSSLVPDLVHRQTYNDSSFAVSQKTFFRNLDLYKTYMAAIDDGFSENTPNFGPSVAEAFSTLNGYLVGDLTQQVEYLIESSQSYSKKSCKVCQSVLIAAKKLAETSKDSISQVIQKLCDGEQGGRYSDSKMCRQLPWNRDITVQQEDMHEVQMFKRSLAKRRFSELGKVMQPKSHMFYKHAKPKDTDYTDDTDDPKKFKQRTRYKPSNNKPSYGDDNEWEDPNTLRSNFANDIANILDLMDPDGPDGEIFCYMFGLKSCGLPKLSEPNLDSWWPPKPKNAKEPVPCGETFNVLHLSDAHLQRHYTPGSEANCVGLMCCQPDSIYVPASKKGGSSNRMDGPFPAPKMGHYRCDTPETLLDSCLEDVTLTGYALNYENEMKDAPAVSSHTSNESNVVNNPGKKMPKYKGKPDLSFEFAIFTGDMVDHDSITISYEDSVWEEEESLKKFKQYLGGVPVYTVLGNHDTYPYGQVAQHKSGYSNLFDWNNELMIHLWKEFGWLEGEKNWPGSEKKAFESARKHYGGFAITTRQGLRVISLNSNFWYMWNLYNYWDTKDPDTSGTLKFLSDELLECEKKGQYAWIIAHVPPGGVDDDALPGSSATLTKIVQRFSPHVITGIFFGHTHQDEYQLVYAGNALDHVLEQTDGKGTGIKPLNVAWISQSITPLVNYNPGWRYYEVDKKTFQIMDSVNFYTPLNESFPQDRDYTNWDFLYNARSFYDPLGKWPANKPLNAQFWHHVALSIRHDGDFCQDYIDNGYRRSPYTPQCTSLECRKQTYCYVTSFNSVQASACKKFLEIDHSR